MTAPSGRLGIFTHTSERRYVMDVPTLGITFDLARLRRERHELIGELIVRCTMAGARTIDGVLSAADFNCSGAQARATRAKFLAERARTKPGDVDWVGLVEEFCQRLVTFNRQGSVDRAFSDIEPGEVASEFMVDGLPLLRAHPVIWFGDGGSGKSLLALHVGAQLAASGEAVLYADWEFSAEDHRERLDKLCNGRGIPETFRYVRCTSPLIEEVDRLAEIIAMRKITYLICDSVGFACAGAPESAEAALEYFRALRTLKVGSLNIAHPAKGGDETEWKPFGSNFWHQGARATWFIKRADDDLDGRTLDIAFINRKNNIGRKRPAPIGRRVRFLNSETTVTDFEVPAHHELSVKLPLWQRLRAELTRGPVATAELAERLAASEGAIRTAVSRMKLFVRLPDGKLALSTKGDDYEAF